MANIAEFKGAGGVRLRGATFGAPDDPPVLLLPAGGQHHTSLLNAGRALGAAGRYAICLDLRGHGLSEQSSSGEYSLDAYVEDIRCVLRQVTTRPVVLATGISGINAAIAIGEAGPSAASALVLVGVSPWMNHDAMRDAVESLRLQAAGFETSAQALSALHHGEPGADNDDDKLLRIGDDGRFYPHWDPRIIGQFNVKSAFSRFRAAAAHIQTPTLIVRSGLSAMVPEESAKRLQTEIAGAELVNLGQAGYHAMIDDRDGFNAVVLEFLERRAPRAPLSYEDGADPRTLRDALGCFGTGVTIVTAFDKHDAPVGLTANSFTSLSLDPPLLLFCLAKRSASLHAFETTERFAINVLHIGQQIDSMRFASADRNRFADVEWERWQDSAPILRHSLVSFDCARTAVHEGGDHLIFVGRVLRARYEPRRDPLLYFKGKYQRLHLA